MDEWAPSPQESGSLDPPRRVPPTAVGIATPPPPRRRDGEHYVRQSRLHHVARATVGFLTTGGSAMALASLLPTAASMTVVIALAGLLLAFHVRRRRWRHVRAHRQRSASSAA